MAEKYLEISKIGGCRGNIGHVKKKRPLDYARGDNNKKTRSTERAILFT